MLHQWPNASQGCSLPGDGVPFLQKYSVNTAYNDHAVSTQHHRSLFLGISLVFAASVTFGIYQRRRLDHQPKVFPVDAVHALSAVFTPTSSAWPAKFAYYFESASIVRSKSATHRRQWIHVLGYGQGQNVIEVDLSTLMVHVLTGNVELRDPSDLGPLFFGSLKMYAWNIRLRVGWGWWHEVARWLAVQHMPSVEWVSPQVLPALADETPNFVDLDFIPFQKMEAYVRAISNRHRSSPSITVEFSSIKPEIRFMSLDFLLCAIALLPEWKGGGQRNHGLTRNSPLKTSTPLFIRLQSVVACITFTKSFKIKSITNISAQHEASLLSKERDLVEKKDLRTRTIREEGIRGWREEGLRLAWEAGLLRAGLLHRWSIQLSKE